MTSVVFRYLFAETARTWATIAGVLLFLTLGLGLSRFIGDAAAGQVPVNTVLGLAAFSTVKNLEIVLPISMLLAILLVVGRLCRDNEMAALFAGGAGLATVYRPFFALAVAVALLAGVVTIFVTPHTEAAMNRLGAQTVLTAVESLAPGRFVTFDDGNVAFYAQRRDAQGDLRGIFARVTGKDSNDNEKDKPTQTIITAQRAREQVDPATQQVTLVLDNGWRYEGEPGQLDYRIVKFSQHGLHMRPPAAREKRDTDTQSTVALMASNDPEAVAEWQTRISVPLSILILTLLALPLGRVPPRAGRYGRVIAGILFYVIYVNLVHLSSVAIENGNLPGIIGEWWVHLVVLAIAIVLVLREQGHLRRRPRTAAQEEAA